MGLFGGRTGLRAAAGLGAAVVLFTGIAAPTGAATPKGWQVTPGAFGLMYGKTDTSSLSAIRAWESATWCRVQPTENADIMANLAAHLGPELDAQLANGATTAIVGLGHPAPWVFENHPKAASSAIEYSCGNNAAGVSIPSTASLKPARNGTPSVQSQRWNKYVASVVDFVNQRYGSSLQVLLQVYNEPNLTSGLDPKRKVPGAAWTIKDAVTSLHTYEQITSDVLRSRNNPAIKLTSTSMFQKPNEFFTRYMAAHNRKPVISSLSFNVYTIKAKNPEKMNDEWNMRVAKVMKFVRKYPKLRRLPAYITETNLNLVNNSWDHSNTKPAVTATAMQRRLATATQMDAFFHGYSAVYWLIPSTRQAAVQISPDPGSPSRAALAVLRSALLGRTMQGCASRSGVRSCTFRDPSGASRDLKVYWRMHGASKVKGVPAARVTQMDGTRSNFGGGSLSVGTTPIVVQPL